MRTDVSLIHKQKSEKIIIDAKFYKNIFQVHHGKSSFHSHNMYQLFTYLMHQSAELSLRGILIYPVNDVEIDEKYSWDERIKIEVKSVDLNGSWSNIYKDLKSVIELERI